MSSTVPEGKPRSRGGRVLLIGSLALNLFLVGLLVGGWAGGVRILGPVMIQGRAPLFGGAEMDLRQVASMLPEQSRTKLREIMRDAFPEMRPALREGRQARLEINRALQAKPFDVASLGAAFEQSRDADQRVRTLFHETFLEFVGTLDDQEREFLYQAIKNTRREPPGPALMLRRRGADDLARPGRRERFMRPSSRRPLEDNGVPETGEESSP